MCKACYQREHARPLRRCRDCGQDKPVSRVTDVGPLCEKCDDRRAPAVRCPRCGKTRKVGILSTGVCRACAQQASPRQPCRNCRRVLAVAVIAGTRWHVEECFQQAKNETGLDHYQVRSWRAWYAHVTLSMLALAWLAVTRTLAAKGESASAIRA